MRSLTALPPRDPRRVRPALRARRRASSASPAHSGAYRVDLSSPARVAHVVSTAEQLVQLTGTDSTVKVWFVSSLVTFFLASTYLFGVVEAAARRSVLWEASISVALPIVTYAYFVTRDAASVAPKRTGELIFIESGFDVLAVLAKVSILYLDGWGNGLLFWGFALFFAVQTAGFLRSELHERKLASVLRSVSLFLHITLQWWWARQRAYDDHLANVVDADGRLLPFGSDASRMLIAHYAFWVAGVLYVDYRSMLPNSALQAVHAASVVVAAFSGEFWHARLLTASHLFVLDAILWFREGITVVEAPFCHMPQTAFVLYDQLIPLVNVVSFVGCAGCLLGGWWCGPQ